MLLGEWNDVLFHSWCYAVGGIMVLFASICGLDGMMVLLFASMVLFAAIGDLGGMTVLLFDSWSCCLY